MGKLQPNEIATVLPRDSWFADYVELYPTCEAPNSYLLFAAMSMMGAALGRKCWYSQDFRKLWPMLNLLLIGPSGVGKGTAIHLCHKLLEAMPAGERPQFIIGGATPERLHEDLVPNPHAIIYAAELANFFNRQKYMEGMIPYVTELLDYEPVEKRTRSGGILCIPEPSVTVVGGSTVDWLQGALPDNAVGGGFLPRFLVVKEDFRRKRVANPELYLGKSEKLALENRRAKAFGEFYHIVVAAEGNIPLADFGVSDVHEIWYNSHKPASEFLQPFAARADTQVLRMAMLIAISCFRDSISEGDIRAAIRLYEYTESKLQEVVVPYTPAGKMQALVLQSIPREDGIDGKVLKRNLKNFMTALDSERYIQSLLAMDEIKYHDGKFYRC